MHNIIATQVGFDPAEYTVNEDAGVVELSITTNDPTRFVDATGALFYTDITNGTATSGGGMSITHPHTHKHSHNCASVTCLYQRTCTHT